jgi:NADH dehydrogenase
MTVETADAVPKAAAGLRTKTGPGVRHRVVILGGGFAGVYTAKHLTRMLGSRRDVHVELLSEENYFVFQPLLPEVAAGSISPTHVVNPIRDIIPKAHFRWCKINRVDMLRKVVLVAQGEARALTEVPYDQLVFGLGKVSDFASMPGVSEHGLPMKDLGDAFRLRNHVFRCLELADIEEDPAEKQALLTFVVAGGGFSGVETTGELSEMMHKCLRSFRRIAMADVRLCLVHSGDAVLNQLAPNLGRAAERILRRRNIELILNTRVRAATRHGVYLSNGRFLPTRTFVCTVGNAANPVAKEMLDKGGFVEGKIEGRGVGVLATDLTLACTNRPGYWAVGDNAGVPDPVSLDQLCPATAQFAVRQAKTCARNILATIDGRPLAKFRFKTFGMLASLGRRAAVADIMGMPFSGFLAWCVWRAVYFVKLPGIVRRLRVAVDWNLELLFPRDITQIQTTKTDHLRLDHYEPGELIINKHEIGREVFIMKSGEVEVFQPGENGQAETVVAKLGAGEVFGEKALLDDLPRGASVRATTAVDVLTISRDDFVAIVSKFPPLDDYFEKLMKERYPADLPATASLVERLATPVALPGMNSAG